MGMLSCQRPPRYHAGSLGVRRIMAAAGGDFHAVRRKCREARRPPCRMSITGRCQSALDQFDGRHPRREVEQARCADEIFRGVSGGNMAAPGSARRRARDEQHLHRAAAAVPVSLFEVWGHAAHAGAEALGDHGGERRVAPAAAPSCHRRWTSTRWRPTLPLDHGCPAIHEMASEPSEGGAPRMS